MSNIILVIIFSLIGGVVSLLGAVFLSSLNDKTVTISKYATPFAAGALLGAVFFDLLKEGLEEYSVDSVLIGALGGILLFFVLERFLHWFHHHSHGEHSTKRESAPLIIIGDTLHNALDGVVIAGAFLINIPSGIVTTIAVALHEIPQEIGDFGLLLSKGYSRRKALIINVLSALMTTVAAVIMYLLGTSVEVPLGVILGLSSGFLLYIALSDIIPHLHEQAPRKKIIDTQTILLFIGVIVVAISTSIAHNYITHGQEEASTQEIHQTEDDHDH